MTIKEYKDKLKLPIREVTLGFLLRGDELLLAEKKVRFGKGKVTGVGGKLMGKEALEDALSREIFEEIGVRPLKMQKVAVLNFYFPYKKEFIEEGTNNKYSWDQQVHTFFVQDWSGEPQESEEIKPVWFKFGDVPYDRMWPDAVYYLPLILKGDKLTADFIYGKELGIDDFEIRCSF